MPVEIDFIANLGLLMVDPGVGHVGPNLTLEIGLHVFLERHVLEIAQFGIGFVFDLGTRLFDNDGFSFCVDFGEGFAEGLGL